MDNAQKLSNLFLELFLYSIPEELKDTLFFAPPINMNARAFLILFMEVENVFSIRFSDDDIKDMKIATYSSLLKGIELLTNTSDVAVI